MSSDEKIAKLAIFKCRLCYLEELKNQAIVGLASFFLKTLKAKMEIWIYVVVELLNPETEYGLP